MDGAFEPVAVELVAQGVIGKRVDEMESGFLMALDYMIQLAHKDSDDEVLDRAIAYVHSFSYVLLALPTCKYFQYQNGASDVFF